MRHSRHDVLADIILHSSAATGVRVPRIDGSDEAP
jgi:hypothetical protein